MGSFILQDYIQRFGADINKAIICGSNGPSVKNKLGAPIIRTVARFKGRDYRSKFVHDLAFGGYNKQFKPGRTEFDWLSRDEQQVDLYAADPYCGYMPTVGFYAEFVKGINRLNKHKFLNKVPKDLPILLIAGSKDPVGNNGKGVRKLERIYKKYGMNVTAMLYEDMRHEILNEVGKQQVYDDILSFLQK